MHCYVPLLAEKLRYDLKMEENKGKTKDDHWKNDRTDKSYLGWLIMMGQMHNGGWRDLVWFLVLAII